MEHYIDVLARKICNFCDDCDHKYDCGGYEEFWGAMVERPDVTCDAELDPEWDECPRHEEFQELLDEMKEEEEKEEDDE